MKTYVTKERPPTKADEYFNKVVENLFSDRSALSEPELDNEVLRELDSGRQYGYYIDSIARELMLNNLTVVFGRVIESYPTVNFYLVIPLLGNQTPISCSSISMNSGSYGVRDQSGYSIGDLVLLIYDKAEKRGYIFGSWYEPLIFSSDLTGDRISEHSITLQDLPGLHNVIRYSLGSLVSGAMNVDSYCNEFCKSTETGSMLFLDRFMGMMRMSEFCGLWMFYNDYLMRMRFNNFECSSPSYKRSIKEDPIYFRIDSQQLRQLITEITDHESQDLILTKYGWPYRNLAFLFKQSSGLNLSSYRGGSYLSSTLGGRVHNISETFNVTGLYSIYARRALFFSQFYNLPQFERLLEPDDLSGDDYTNITDAVNTELFKEIRRNQDYISNYKDKVSDFASGVIDRVNFHFNDEVFGKIRNRRKDYKTFNKVDLFNPRGDNNKTIKFVKKLRDNGSYEESDVVSSEVGSFFSILEDGSFVLANGHGCEIRLEKDNIYIRAPNIYIQSGDKTVLWGGNHIYMRSRFDSQFNSTKGNIKINSTKGRTEISGAQTSISSTDGNLVLSNQTGYSDDGINSGECPHIALGSDFVKVSAIKSNDTDSLGRIVLTSQELYLSGSEKIACEYYSIDVNVPPFKFVYNDSGVEKLIPEPLWYRIYVSYGMEDKVEDWVEEQLPNNRGYPWGNNNLDKIYKQELGYTKNIRGEGGVVDGFGRPYTESIKDKWPVLKDACTNV